MTRSLCYYVDQMLIFAHTGIPLSVAWLSHKAILQARHGSTAKPKVSRANSASAVDCLLDNRSGTDSLASRLDYRLMLLGSVLPDLIDKPLGIWLLRDTLSNGRVFAHTLLFAVLLMAVGIYVYIGRRKVNLLCLSFGNIAHLGLDEMWLDRGTFFWPLYDWSFERTDVSHWLDSIVVSLRTEPGVYIPEILGAPLLSIFLVSIIRKGKLYPFFRTGEAD